MCKNCICWKGQCEVPHKQRLLLFITLTICGRFFVADFGIPALSLLECMFLHFSSEHWCCAVGGHCCGFYNEPS